VIQRNGATIERAVLMLSGRKVTIWTGGVGPALLLLHSAWGDAEMSWQPVWNELARSFTVIAPDLPGFGASDPLVAPSLAANARLLRELLDSRNVDRAIVAGNSFGAAVAIEFATSFPDRTQNLVLVNGGFLPALPGFMRKLLRLRYAEKKIRSLMRKMTYSDKAFAKAFPDPEKLPPGIFERIRRNEESQARTVFNTFMNQTAPQRTPAVPVAFIWGTGDRLTSMKQAGLVRTWPSAPKLVPLNGAGHMPQLEQPKEFVEALKIGSGSRA